MTDVSMSQSLGHDPLCTWRQAEEADAGDPRRWLAGGLAVCDCTLIAKVREDMLAKCIAAVEAAARDRIHDLRGCNKDDDCHVKAEGVALMLDDALYELRALQESDSR